MSNQFAPITLNYRQWVAPLGWTVASVAALSALLLQALPAVSTWLWVASFLIAGTLCSSAYVRRCSRLHCYITGPLFLLSAFYLGTVELSLVPFMGNTWFFVVVLGTTALAFLAEMIVVTAISPHTDREGKWLSKKGGVSMVPIPFQEMITARHAEDTTI